jgi:hypothetical protein
MGPVSVLTTPIHFWSMTDRTPVFHLLFQRLLKKVFYWPPNPKLYGEPPIWLAGKD